ncbi:MAG TPA: hypothetical protein VG518_07480 [Solirubrobacterales bacterium]|nr:hypothetical protein [Solirubrobacterales bacterium]
MLALAALALAAKPALASPCEQACVVHLPPSPDRVSGWTSHYRLLTSLLEVEVRSHREKVPFNRSSQEGCVAWFIGKGVKLQLAVCEPQPLVFIAYKARQAVKVRISIGTPRLGPAPGFGLEPGA